MAEVNTGGSGGGKHQKKRAKRSSTRIDMTPMVDLAFLLLTFFVMTSTFAKPKAMEITYPADPDDPKERTKINNALTVILTEKNQVYWYYGEFMAEGMPNPDGLPLTTLTKTDFSDKGLRKIFLEKNDPTIKELKKLEDQFKKKEFVDSIYTKKAYDIRADKKALTVLVKSDDKAVYKNIVDVIDELKITSIAKYAMVDMEKKEMELLNSVKNK